MNKVKVVLPQHHTKTQGPAWINNTIIGTLDANKFMAPLLLLFCEVSPFETLQVRSELCKFLGDFLTEGRGLMGTTNDKSLQVRTDCFD